MIVKTIPAISIFAIFVVKDIVLEGITGIQKHPIEKGGGTFEIRPLALFSTL